MFFAWWTEITQKDRNSTKISVQGDHYFRGILVPRTKFFRTEIPLTGHQARRMLIGTDV